MATLGSLSSDISERLLDDNNIEVKLPDVVTAINEAIDYYCEDAFKFNQKYATVTVLANNPVIPVPADFQVPQEQDGFVLIFQDEKIELLKLSLQDFIYRTRIINPCRPRFYVWDSGVYKIDVNPTQNYTLEVRYLKKYDGLVNPDDYNDFTLNAVNLIMYRACSRLMAELRQDVQMEEYYTARADSEFLELIAKANKVAAAGYNQLESFLFC